MSEADALLALDDYASSALDDAGAAALEESLFDAVAEGPPPPALALREAIVFGVRDLVARGTWLDLCPTSNTQARIVPTIADHPLARLARAGVRVTLNTDDLTVSDLSLSDEYVRAVERIGLSVPELWAIDLAALDAAFCDDATRARLRDEFRAWGAGIPELHEG